MKIDHNLAVNLGCYLVSAKFYSIPFMSKVLWVDGHLGLNCSICLSKGTYQKITIAYLRGEELWSVLIQVNA
jgi:hypothetical protein